MNRGHGMLAQVAASLAVVVEPGAGNGGGPLFPRCFPAEAAKIT